MEKNILDLFKSFSRKEISDVFFIGTLKVFVDTIKLQTLNEPMFRFNNNTILYTYYEIEKDLFNSTKENKAFLIENIENAIENNTINVIM